MDYLICVVIGFVLGYGVREAISRHRRARVRRERRNKYGLWISKSGRWISRVHTICRRHKVERGLVWLRRQAFLFDPSRNSVSAKDSNPTLRGHSRAPSPGLRQKSAFAQAVNYNGRRVAILEKCKISQKTQIAPLQIALHPRAGKW